MLYDGIQFIKCCVVNFLMSESKCKALPKPVQDARHEIYQAKLRKFTTHNIL